MASLHKSVAKRPRAQTNDDVSRKSRNKRQRPATLTPGSSEVDTSSEAESRNSDDVSGSEHGGDDAEEELAMQQATQQVAKHLRASEKQNTAAEQGIIEEVRCTNFMCHEQLTVPLGPLINFIIGHNGSGKSAVLTALTLCLGGKATATNRGQNLKSFIKEGRDQCTLAVKIKNRGSSAYKPDMYGESIIVERHFNRAGSSGFKLKDRNGKIVSTKKAELEDIIDAFALQLDNPMNVLTQDNARQFLNDSNAKDKYKFFLKGTQLEGLRGEYDLLRHNTDSQQSKAETLMDDIEILRKKMEEAVKKAKQASSVDAMRRRERLLANQIAWARVEDEEQDLRNIDSEIEIVNRTIDQKTADASEHSERYELAHQAHSAANEMKEDRQAQLGPVQDECTELKVKFGETTKALTKVVTTERGLIATIHNKQKAVDRYEAQIEEQKQRQAEADGGQHAQKMRELEEAKQAQEHAKDALTNHNNILPNLKQDLQTAQDRKQPANARLRDQQQAEQRSKTAIRDLEQGQRNWMDSYPNPNKLDRLLQLIKQHERRFGSPPVGPMGRHLKLLKPEWSSILEKSSGASMNAFIVTSKADQLLLSNLMKTAGCQSQHPIYIGREAIKTALQEPDPHLDTWLRVLKFDNVLVRDQMIINHSIEQVVLIRERSEAQDFMLKGGSPRRNVRVCFAMMDGNPKKGHSIQVSAQSGALTINPILDFTGRGRMQADKEPLLIEERKNLARIEQQISDTDAEIRELNHEVNRFNRAVQDHDARKRQLREDFRRSQETVDRLEAELADATPDAGLIENLQESLEVVKEEKKFQEDQFIDITTEKDRLNRDARTQKDALADANQRLADLNCEFDKAQARVDKLSGKREAALRLKNRALDEVNAAQENKAEWEQKRQEQAGIVEENVSEAEKISNRVEVPHGETEESLTRKLATLSGQIALAEQELGGSEKELIDRALAAKRMHKAKGDELAGTKSLIDAFKKSLKIRDDRWHRFKKDISRRARVTFTYLLSERQFRGDLAIDHHNKQLEIHVQPDITVINGTGRQTKTLSGGEKSFSTICLLLALWDAMGSPIRCLDEFDVFMDSVNRDISMKMMVAAARRAVGRQYILITPQAMNSVKNMDDVKIIRMTDPERGQTALSVGR